MESIKWTEIEVGGQNIKNKQHQHVKIEKRLSYVKETKNLSCYSGLYGKYNMLEIFQFVNKTISVLPYDLLQHVT